MNYLDYLVIAGYIAVLLSIGAYFYFKKTADTTENYLLGGRNVPWWAAGISNFVAILSTFTLVAVPGEAYNYGVSLLVMSFISPAAAVVAIVVLGRFYFKNKIFTPFEYVAGRFGTSVRFLTAIMFWLMRFIYLGIVLYASAQVFKGAFDLPLIISILVIGVVGVIVTYFGGLKGVVWADIFQFVLIIGGMVTILCICVYKLPFGIGGIIEYSFSHGRGFEYFKDANFFTFSPFVRLNFWVLIFSAIAAEMFSHGCDQMSVQKLLSTSSLGNAIRATLVYSLISFPFSIMCYLIGLAIFVFFTFNPPAKAITGDTAMFHFISSQMASPLPGLVIVGLVAAAITTISAGCNSLATVFLKDIYIPLVKNSNEHNQVVLAKRTTFGFGIAIIIVGLLIVFINNIVGQTVLETTSLWFAYFLPIWTIFFLAATTRLVSGRQILFIVVLSWIICTAMIIWYILSKSSDRPLSFMLLPIPSTIFILASGYICELFAKFHKSPAQTVSIQPRYSDTKLKVN